MGIAEVEREHQARLQAPADHRSAVINTVAAQS